MFINVCLSRSIVASVLLFSFAVASFGQAKATGRKMDPRKVSLDQKLDAVVPQNLSFVDESGRLVRLSEYVGKKPVILNMIFYKCPGVCMQELEGMTRLFRDPQMTLSPGKDFEVITVSINPKESPSMAMEKKKEFLSLLGKSGVENGWHFLTGSQENIQALANAVGFRYDYDLVSEQFAHPAGIILLTSNGLVSKYFYKADYPARDVRFALVEASKNKIGSLSDKFFLNCIYQYDPATGRYGVAIMKTLRFGGVLTFIILVASIGWMSFKNGITKIEPSDIAHERVSKSSAPI